MLPLSPARAKDLGLIDGVYRGDPAARFSEPEQAQLGVLGRYFGPVGENPPACAPWAAGKGAHNGNLADRVRAAPVVDWMCHNKRNYFRQSRLDMLGEPPLLHYRNEELSHMLLDCFHPVRSQRYHTRRKAFIRKFKCDQTPTRYVAVKPDDLVLDAEDTEAFDHVGPWKRGQEWAYVETVPPSSLESSAWTVIPLFPESGYQFDEFLSDEQKLCKRLAIVEKAYQSLLDTQIEMSNSHTDKGGAKAPLASSRSDSTLGEVLQSPPNEFVEDAALKVHITGSDGHGGTEAPQADEKRSSPVETMYPCLYAEPVEHATQ